MAVQAQYPPNVLLLNRGGQEGKVTTVGHDYSLQQPSVGYLDQSQMFFNHINSVGTNNARKRGRDTAAADDDDAGVAVPIAGFPVHPQAQPLLIDLAHHRHYAKQSNGVVSTGLRLAFGDQSHQNQRHQQHQLQQQLQPQPQPQPQQSVLSALLSDDLATQIKQQRDELDQFLQAQGEQLRRTLAEKRQRHYRSLLSAAEEAAARRLNERTAEVERAARRNKELEAKVAQLSREAHAWQAKVRAQEAAAATLQAQLQQAILRAGGGGSVDHRRDVGGGEGGNQADDAESAYVDPERVAEPAAGVLVCRACGNRVASVVLLPCRHLCLCTDCNGVVQACPLCFSVRKTSVEVNFP